MRNVKWVAIELKHGRWWRLGIMNLMAIFDLHYSKENGTSGGRWHNRCMITSCILHNPSTIQSAFLLSSWKYLQFSPAIGKHNKLVTGMNIWHQQSILLLCAAGLCVMRNHVDSYILTAISKEDLMSEYSLWGGDQL